MRRALLNGHSVLDDEMAAMEKRLVGESDEALGGFSGLCALAVDIFLPEQIENHDNGARCLTKVMTWDLSMSGACEDEYLPDSP